MTTPPPHRAGVEVTFGYASATLWTRFQWLAIARLALHVTTKEAATAARVVVVVGCLAFILDSQKNFCLHLSDTNGICFSTFNGCLYSYIFVHECYVTIVSSLLLFAAVIIPGNPPQLLIVP